MPVLVLSALAAARAQAPAVLDAAQTQLALKRLTVLGTALYVGAHPDDENTALLAYLANERGAARFPEQLKYVRPWQPKRLVWNAFVRQGERPPDPDKLADDGSTIFVVVESKWNLQAFTSILW